MPDQIKVLTNGLNRNGDERRVGLTFVHITGGPFERLNKLSVMDPDTGRQA